MAKKTKEVLYAEARELYLNTDLKLSEIAEQLGIKVNTIYTISNREKWALLKESRLKEIISDRNIMLNSRKVKSIEFYDKVLDKCNSLLYEEGVMGKELKLICETHILAETRLFLLAKEKLEVVEKDEEGNSEGILAELAKM